MSKAVSLSAVPADVQSTNTGLAAIHLFVDGVEEPLSADRGNKVAAKRTQTVSAARRRERAARDGINLSAGCRQFAADDGGSAQGGGGHTSRRGGAAFDIAADGPGARISRADRNGRAHTIVRPRSLCARSFPRFPRSAGRKAPAFRALPPTSWLNVAAARSRIAVERWKRADGLHRAMQPKQPKPPKGEKGATKPPLLPPDRGLVMLEHGWARLGRSQSSSRRNSPSGFYAPPAAAPTGQLMCDPMDGVSRELKEFLRANYLPLMARLRAASEPAPSTGEKIFEKVEAARRPSLPPRRPIGSLRGV